MADVSGIELHSLAERPELGDRLYDFGDLWYGCGGAWRAAPAPRGFDARSAPVGPNEKHRGPELPMDDYVRRLRPDGLPADAWIRAHVRVGGTVVKVCPVSMTFGGSLA